MKILRVYGRCNLRIFVKLASLLPLLLLSASISAQEADSARAPQRVIPSHQRLSPDERGKVLARYLELDETQQMALQKILEQRQQEVLQMRFTPVPRGSAQIDRFRSLQDKTVNRIRAVLNQEQRKKYDLMVSPKATPSASKTSVQDWLKAAIPQ